MKGTVETRMAAFSYWNRGTSVYSATADLYRATFDELLISLWRRYWYRSNGAVHTCTGTCADANVFVTERNSAFSLFQFIVVALDRWPPLETGATARLSTFDRFEFSSRTLCSQLVHIENQVYRQLEFCTIEEGSSAKGSCHNYSVKEILWILWKVMFQ